MKSHNLLILALLATTQPATSQEPVAPGQLSSVQKGTLQTASMDAAGTPRSATLELPDLASELTLTDPKIDPDRVYFDAPGDGRLWARGMTYKASFDQAGTVFSPYLGPDADGPRPVTFRLDEITVGGRPIEFARSVPASLQESGKAGIVSFDRGSFVEHYVMGPESMEQRFRFDQPLGVSGGDLSIKMRVETNLAARESDDGFAFDCEWGSVNYGRAIVFDALGDQVSAPTELTPGGIEIRVPGSFLTSARYPLTIDPIISTFGISNQGFFDLQPDIAYEQQSGRYMVVWQRLFAAGDWDVISLMYNSLGNVINNSSEYVDMTSRSWDDPCIASNYISSQFLVVANDEDLHIVGRTRQADTLVQGLQFYIATSALSVYSNPDVGGDPHPLGPTFYCVTWQATDLIGEKDIEAQLVTVTSELEGSRVTLSEEGPEDTNPQVSGSDGQRPALNQAWTVVWEKRPNILSTKQIWGAQLTWNGNPTSPFLISHSIDDSSLNPTVSSVLDGQSGDRPYLVAFERDNVGQTDIYGRVMKGSTAVTPTLNLTQLQSIGVPQQQGDPTVEADGSSFMLANTENGNIFMGTLNLSGATLIAAESHLEVTSDANNQVTPRIASMHSGGGSQGLYMGVWGTVIAMFESDIDGGTFISPGPGDTYCTSNANTAGTVGTLSAQGSISISKGTFTLVAENCPPNKSGLFFLGPNQINTAFGEGRRCVGGQIKRVVPIATTNAQGLVSRQLNMQLPYASGIFAGPGGVNYQFWFRDPAGGPGGFNLTSALHVEHTP